MPSKLQTTVVLTEKAQEIKYDLAPIYGLKNILSAGLILFGQLTDSRQKAAIAEANGLKAPYPALAAQRAAIEDETAAASAAEAVRRKAHPRKNVKSG